MSKRSKPEGARPAQGHRGGASWVDERALGRGDMRVAQGFSALRAEAAFDAATGCEDCAAERAETGDDEGLCEAHLAQAMGMNSTW